ncbi:MAG: DUF4347 domain-containing protein [Oscillatoriales cyanobacterium]|nr:MAG: DUF4347 domain-containing protein [Oscillatoriales cyanobacterium]
MQVAKPGNSCLFLPPIRCIMPNLNTKVSVSAIAFIDSKVEDYQSLIAGVKPGTEVVILDANRDAIEQITEILGDRKNIDSIHIISHGAPGSLQLGKTRFGFKSPSHSESRLKPTGNNSFIQSSLDDLCYETGVSTPGGTGEQATRPFSRTCENRPQIHRSRTISARC